MWINIWINQSISKICSKRSSIQEHLTSLSSPGIHTLRCENSRPTEKGSEMIFKLRYTFSLSLWKHVWAKMTLKTLSCSAVWVCWNIIMTYIVKLNEFDHISQYFMCHFFTLFHFFVLCSGRASGRACTVSDLISTDLWSRGRWHRWVMLRALLWLVGSRQFSLKDGRRHTTDTTDTGLGDLESGKRYKPRWCLCSILCTWFYMFHWCLYMFIYVYILFINGVSDCSQC